MVRHKAFFTEHNTWRYLPPFMIVTKVLQPNNESEESPQFKLPSELNYSNVNSVEGIPHTSELLTVYEDFHHEKYPLKEICLLSYKCKCQSHFLDLIYLFVFFLVFIVQYTSSLIHAMDGLGHGIIMLPINGNLILKIYDESKGESYANCILPLAEIRDLMDAEIRTWGRRD